MGVLRLAGLAGAFGALLLAADGSGRAAPGELVYVQPLKLNVREGPGRDWPVMMTLDRGHKLFVFQAEGKWVYVGIENSGGVLGWVHGGLTVDQAPGGELANSEPEPETEPEADAAEPAPVMPAAEPFRTNDAPAD